MSFPRRKVGWYLWGLHISTHCQILHQKVSPRKIRFFLTSKLKGLPSSKINIMAKACFAHFEFTYLEGYFRPESTLRGRIMRCRDFYDYLLCTYNPLMMIPIGQELGSEKPNRHACNATLRAVQFFDLVVVGGARQNTITQSFFFRVIIVLVTWFHAWKPLHTTNCGVLPHKTRNSAFFSLAF